MGVCGKSEKEAALTTMKEYRLLLEGFDRKREVFWETARWMAFNDVMLSPNIKQFNKPRTLHQFHPFPWDAQERDVTAEDLKVTPEQEAAFNAIVKDLLAKHNNAS